MKVFNTHNSTIKFNNNSNKIAKYSAYQNSKPLAHDTVSFKARQITSSENLIDPPKDYYWINNTTLVNSKTGEKVSAESLGIINNSKRETSATSISSLPFISPNGTKISGPFKEIYMQKSTSAKGIKLEKRMKNIGCDAYFSDNIETAKIITEAFEKLVKKGYKLPNEVLLMTPKQEGILGYKPYSLKEKRYQTPIIFSKDLTTAFKNNEKEIIQGIKYNSTNDALGVVYHEIGHFLHEESEPDISDSIEIWKYMANDGYDINLAKEVGYYAMTGDKFHSGKEYVAEVFAGLMEGKEYSERVMKLYYALNGPKV